MILQSVWIYGVLCTVPLVYGIGLKKLSDFAKSPVYVLLSAIKSLFVTLLTICTVYFFAAKLLAAYSLAVLFPLFCLPVAVLISQGLNRLVSVWYKVETAEFDVAFLAILLAVSEAFGFIQALFIGTVSIAAFYILVPVLAAIRKRLQLTCIHPAFTDAVTVFITLAFVACGFYGWHLSWLNAGMFR